MIITAAQTTYFKSAATQFKLTVFMDAVHVFQVVLY